MEGPTNRAMPCCGIEQQLGAQHAHLDVLLGHLERGGVLPFVLAQRGRHHLDALGKRLKEEEKARHEP